MEKPARAKVAVVRGDRRRGAVAEAFSLISGEIAEIVAPSTVIVPHLSDDPRPGASTHADTISATVDALLAAGAGTITVAAASPRPKDRAARQFDRLGYLGENWGRPVSFLDLSETPAASAGADAHHLGSRRGGSSPIKIPRAISDADCRVSLAVARKAGLLGGSLGLFNILNVLAASDRERFDPRGIIPGWLPAMLSRGLFGAQDSRDGENSLRDLLILARMIRPSISLIDTFPATKRSGPSRRLWPLRGLAFAGTDPVAVDTVAAMFLGYDRHQTGYLKLAESMGLGTSDPDSIEIVGDRPIQVARLSNQKSSVHWRKRRSGIAESVGRSR